MERECEVDQYLAGPSLDLKSSLFKWWESYHYRYPVLVHLVKQVDILTYVYLKIRHCIYIIPCIIIIKFHSVMIQYYSVKHKHVSIESSL